MGAPGAIELQEIAWPKILDPGRIEGDHFTPDVLYMFLLGQHGSSRIVNREIAS